MKVLDVSDFYSESGGGIRCHLSLKSQALVRLGVDHLVVVPGARDEELTLHSHETEGARHSARLVRVQGPKQPYDASYHFLTRTRRVHEILGRERPDVVELNSPYLAALGALTAPTDGWKPIRTFFWHSNHIDTWATSTLARYVTPTLAERTVAPLWHAMRSLVSRCDAVITTTRWQTQQLAKHGVPRVHLIPFGVDKDTFHPARRSRDRRRELLGGAPESTRLFVAVGRLSAEKRFDVIVEAFLRYRKRHEAVLVVFGEGPERQRLETLAAGCSDVRFLGFEPDSNQLASAFASADALLHGCPHETFGLAVAEALSTGLPAVVPDAGGAYENARGPSAETYPAGDVAACEAAMDRLMARPGEELRALAVQHARTIRPQMDHFREVVALYEALHEAQHGATPHDPRHGAEPRETQGNGEHHETQHSGAPNEAERQGERPRPRPRVSGKVVHVSLHDVSPAFAAEVEQALELCAQHSIRPALLVVPDYHERAPLESHPDFCARLRELQAAGHEIYLHGFTHRSRPAPPQQIGQRGRLAWYFRQRVVSGGEAEFADLTRTEAIERLDQGLEVFERCGFRVDGFVPPAWSMPAWVLPLLAERQIPFTEEHLRIHRPVVGDQRPSLVFNWATRTLERKLSTVAFCRLTRPLVGVLPTRIAIHPADMHSPLVVAEIDRLLARLRGLRIRRGLELFDP